MTVAFIGTVSFLNGFIVESLQDIRLHCIGMLQNFPASHWLLSDEGDAIVKIFLTAIAEIDLSDCAGEVKGRPSRGFREEARSRSGMGTSAVSLSLSQRGRLIR